jgi:hypothetical protein
MFGGEMVENINDNKQIETKPDKKNAADLWNESLRAEWPEYYKTKVRIIKYSSIFMVVWFIAVYVLFYFIVSTPFKDGRFFLLGLSGSIIAGMILYFKMKKPLAKLWDGVIRRMEEKGYKVKRSRIGLKRHIDIIEQSVVEKPVE